MKKWIARIGFIILMIAVSFYLFVLIMDEPLPEGIAGKEADLLAMKMLDSINKQAWDSTRWVSWNYKGQRKYLWDRTRNYLRVEWDDQTVLLDLNNYENVKSYRSGNEIFRDESADLKQTALALFFNDSFWLNAPAKVFDKGTVRSIVSLDDDNKGLLVTYNSGGVTPGDSYLWILDENGRPLSFKMWVSILPWGGIKASWENWKTTDTGAVMATSHTIYFIRIVIDEPKTGDNYSSLNISEDPFLVLIE